MTQPTPYNRQYNFTDFQTSNPNSPLPGAQVDAEFNAVKQTSDQTRVNLGLIQRDDGKLANQSVHKDAFDRDALAMIGLDAFNPRGNWTAATAYQAQDLVNYNNATYACLVAHTAAAAFPTDLNAARWILIANAAIGDVSSAVDYFTGNGTTTAFTLTYTYTSNTGVQVYVNGVLQTPTAGGVTGDYSISGSTLTFVSAPPAPTVAGRKNVVVWGANVTVQANVQAAQTAASNAQGFANAASTSATNAASSATAAASSASAASTSATAAQTARTGAETAQTAAQASQTAAASSATAAANSASSASTSATNSANSATSSANSATSSAASATLANDWATKTSGPVAGGEYSAKYHAQQSVSGATTATTQAGIATTKASEAAASATSAASSQSAAATSASAAATSATNASNSASAASTSATNAANSASAASTSQTAAASSASSASTSALTASTAATTATTQATNSANSAAAALASQNAAATSATNAATSASNALTSANNAASSAASAAASAAAAASTYDSFDDRYLGVKSTPPTVDNDGDPLVAGALYYRSTAPTGMKVYDGAQWIDASSAQQAALVTYEYVATAGQTTFSGADANGLTLSYIAGGVIVSINGLILRPGDEYTATNGTSIVLLSGATAGDEINVYAFASFTVANTYTQAQVDNALSFKVNTSAIDVTVQGYDAATAKTNLTQSFTRAQRGSVTALTDGATITADLAVANNFSVTLGGNRTLANPSNQTAGQHGTIVITQDATGGRTLAFGSNWKFPAGTAPSLTTTANAVDVLAYYVESATRITARLIADVK